MFDIIIRNIILGASLAGTLGPISIETIKRGLRHGFTPAFLVNMGATATDGVFLFLIFFGFSVFIDNPIFKIILWFFGTVVLLYLGIENIREAFMKINLKLSKRAAAGNSFLTGFLLNFTNPMAIVCWIGFYGVVTSAETYAPSLTNTFVNVLTPLIGAAIWGLALSTLTCFGRRFVNEKTMRYVSIIAGLILIGFGFYFGYNAVVSLL